MTTTVRTPRQVFDELLRTSVDGDWEGLLDLDTADRVIEMPFAPPGMPKVSDGAALVRHIRGMSNARPWKVSSAENVVAACEAEGAA
jgi:ketosteroid isomerase-like protein